MTCAKKSNEKADLYSERYKEFLLCADKCLTDNTAHKGDHKFNNLDHVLKESEKFWQEKVAYQFDAEKNGKCLESLMKYLG